MALNPVSSSEYISELSKDVSISQDGIKKTAQVVLNGFRNKHYSTKVWKTHKLNPKEMNEDAVNWIFLADTLNFSFWTKEHSPKYTVTFEGETYTGYWSLCAAINRALQEGIPITDPKFYGTLTVDQLQQIFRSDNEIQMPLLEERIKVLKETATVLQEKFDGKFVNCIKQSSKSAQSLLNLIVENFPSYKDEAEFEGKTVTFYKRAQILIGDIWACFEGEGYGSFHDIDIISMFADYRIPQLLAYFGALQYSDSLMEKLKNGIELKNGCHEEVEIRGCCIWAVELLKEEIKKLSNNEIYLNSIIIDFFLWDYRRDHCDAVDIVPFHHTRSIYY